MNESAEIGWELVFGLIMLRMISFNMEYDTLMKNKDHDKTDNDSKNILHNCEECEKQNYCLKYLANLETVKSDFTLTNYLIYIFYPPLYFAGPTINFNSFIGQMKMKKENHLTKEKLLYILRYIFIFICFEYFNSTIYVNLFLTSGYTEMLWHHYDYYMLAIFSFFILLFLWFKFTIIWRTTRIWAWLDDICTEENMNRCVINNYCFEGFWRAWHKSFNTWLIRYMYLPLGGSKYKILNIWVIFSFVALWHDLKLNLLLWGWMICLAFFPEILVKSYFNRPELKYLNDYFMFRVLKYFCCSFYIVLLVTSNLIGFGMGHKGLLNIMLEILWKTNFTYVVIILMFFVPTSISQMWVRDLEERSAKKINY
jgi:D-alanyl-lipoteichoic acid acyltransferase DltB (MBOAT superfamily)